MRLAAVLSAAAVVLAVTLERTGEISRTALVAAVVIVGFVTSWIQFGRTNRATPPMFHHRVAVIPVRHRVG